MAISFITDTRRVRHGTPTDDGLLRQSARPTPEDGTVTPQNIELNCVTLDASALFQRNLFYDEFDVAEMSISETLLAKERREQYGQGKWDWSALPVFLSRGHVWPNLYVNAASGIASLSDFKGKRSGFPIMI